MKSSPAIPATPREKTAGVAGDAGEGHQNRVTGVAGQQNGNAGNAGNAGDAGAEHQGKRNAGDAGAAGTDVAFLTRRGVNLSHYTIRVKTAQKLFSFIRVRALALTDLLRRVTQKSARSAPAIPRSWRYNSTPRNHSYFSHIRNSTSNPRPCQNPNREILGIHPPAHVNKYYDRH